VEGHQVRHIPWPEDFVIARVQRNSQKVFARGNTVLQAGDILVTVSSEEAFQDALGMCQTRNTAR
jgi:Trk K+ transport system NAD-binding subunit